MGDTAATVAVATVVISVPLAVTDNAVYELLLLKPLLLLTLLLVLHFVM